MSARIRHVFGLWLFSFLSGSTILPGQIVDTIVWMESVKVSDESQTDQEVDTIELTGFGGMNTLIDLLRTESNIYFRDFGPGSSATISLFGSKSNEVALIWNGIKVTNPMLGVNDYSMISSAAMTGLRVAKMGNSTIFGAGSSAGAIIMDQHVIKQEHPISFSAGWSSLNQFGGSASYTKSEGRWRSRTFLDGHSSNNNFRYTTLNGTQERLAHASSHVLNASHQSEYYVGPNQYWTLSIWGREQSREIPPLLTESVSEADQSDVFLRTMIQYYNLKPKHRFHIKAYLGNQNQHYQNPLADINAHHRFHNIQLRMDNEWQPLQSIYIKYGIQENYFSSRSDNYTTNQTQNRVSTYARIQYDLSKIPIDVIFLAQPELVDNQSLGWTTELKFQYQTPFIGHLTVFGSQNINWPTLNDLYWNPGGNPDLRPEKNQMMGFAWKMKWQKNLETSMTLYYRQARDWIQWIPTDFGFWRPENANEGKSYGVNLELKKNFGKRVGVRTGYQFVRTYLQDESSMKRQAIYTPTHMCSVTGIYKINGNWELQVNGEYTSERYVTRDHSTFLEAYALWHGSLLYRINKHPWTIGLQVRNLLNTEYQGVKNRPMPGRQIQLNTQIKF